MSRSATRSTTKTCAPSAAAIWAVIRPTGPAPRTTAGPPACSPPPKATALTQIGPIWPRSTPSSHVRSAGSVWSSGPLRGHGGELGVAPVAVDAMADRHVSGPALHDLARRPVPEHERVVDRRRAGLEQPELLVPLLVEIDVGCVAPVERHLGAGAHRRADRPDPDLPVRQRRRLVDVALDLAGLDDLDRAAADLATRDDAVDRAGHARLPSRGRRAGCRGAHDHVECCPGSRLLPLCRHARAWPGTSLALDPVPVAGPRHSFSSRSRARSSAETREVIPPSGTSAPVSQTSALSTIVRNPSFPQLAW